MAESPLLQSHDGAEAEPVLADWNTAYQLLASGQLVSYRGEFVAILNGQVVASGRDQRQLREEVSQRHHVHGERVVVFYVDAGEEWLQQPL